MFATTDFEYTTKAELYQSLAKQTAHLVEGEPNEIANLSNVSALLNVYMKDINWVGFYLWYEKESTLILGPFQGKPACIRIPSGRGVCGAAVAQKSIQIVPDVFAFPGHIACDADSRSEIVLPIVKDGVLIGVLDIDSPIPNRFDEEDATGLQAVVDALIPQTQFQPR